MSQLLQGVTILTTAVDPDGVVSIISPVDWEGFETEEANFISTATSGNGSGLTHQWQEFLGTWQDMTNGGRVSGVTSTNLKIAGVEASDLNRQFRCTHTNSVNSRNSRSAALLVTIVYVMVTEGLGDDMITEEVVPRTMIQEA